MADQAITALPKKTYSGSSQIASTDYLLGIDSAEGYQMLIQDLGEYIINRATASLAGSTQTLASAISALNTKLTLTGEYNSSESFSSAETLGSKLDALLSAQSLYFIGCYRLSCTASFGVFQKGYDYCVQMARASSLNFVIAEFTPIDNGLIKILGKRRTEGWSFELAPSRSEMDTVIKRGDYKSILDNRFDAHDTQPGSYWVARAANIPDSHQYGFLTHEVSSADAQERLLTFHPYNSPGVFYKATSNNAGSTWTAWYKYTGTQVS